MPRLALVSVVVRRVLEPAAGVPDIRVEDPGDLSQDVLHSPETTASEDGCFGLLRAADWRCGAALLCRHRDPLGRYSRPLLVRRGSRALEHYKMRSRSN